MYTNKGDTQLHKKWLTFHETFATIKTPFMVADNKKAQINNQYDLDYNNSK